jgi:hypothetical protein
MNMIEMYVSEVGEHLPEKMRADIQAEIRSLIEDTLEGRSQAAGRPVDDAMVVEVLTEFGSPEKMASSYLPPRYLIGPRLFPTFMLVIRIVLIVLFVVALIGLGVDLSAPGITTDAIVGIVGKSIADFLTGALAALGNVVFIFAVLEWALPKMADKKETWDPRTLKPREEPERIHPVALVWSTALLAAAILVFNLYPQSIGMIFMRDGQWHIYPLFSQAFFSLVPLMSVAWTMQIILNVLLLRQGRWEMGTRWFQVGIKVFGLVILGMIISGGSIFDLSYARAVFPPGAFRVLEPMANTGFRALLVIVMVVDTVEIIKMLVRLGTKKDISLLPG